MKNKPSLNYITAPGIISEPARTSITPDIIIMCVNKALNVTRPQLNGNSRKRIIAEARHITMYLIRKNTDMSFKCIGYMFGKRDHTTAIHSVSLSVDLIGSDEKFTAKHDSVVKFIYELTLNNDKTIDLSSQGLRPAHRIHNAQLGDANIKQSTSN